MRLRFMGQHAEARRGRHRLHQRDAGRLRGRPTRGDSVCRPATDRASARFRERLERVGRGQLPGARYGPRPRLPRSGSALRGRCGECRSHARMIFCEKLLFLHVPKAAGSSLTQVLLERLPRPTYYTHPEDFYEGRDDGVIHLPGGAHETLAEAGEIIASYGFELSDLGVILGVVRNPYALEVSRYFYLRTANPYDIGYNQALALTSDFETFALKSKPHGWLKRPIESYFTLDGEVPPNMRILRMEHLLEDLNAALETVALPPVENLPATNTSDHGHFIDYYTPRAEKSVFERYRWLFDQGFYQRIDPKQLVGTQTGGMAPSADSTIQSGSMVSPEELAAPLI